MKNLLKLKKNYFRQHAHYFIMCELYEGTTPKFHFFEVLAILSFVTVATNFCLQQSTFGDSYG